MTRALLKVLSGIDLYINGALKVLMGVGDDGFAGFCQISVGSVAVGLRVKDDDEEDGAAAPWRAWKLIWVVEDMFVEWGDLKEMRYEL